MVLATEAADLELSGDTLIIRGAASQEDVGAWCVALRCLLGLDYPRLTLDLRGVKCLTGYLAGVVARTAIEASCQSRTMTIRASERVARVFRQIGIGSFCSVEGVLPHGGPIGTRRTAWKMGARKEECRSPKVPGDARGQGRSTS